MNKRVENIITQIRYYIPVVVMVLILAVPASWAFFALYHVDVEEACLVRVKKHVPGGNRETIKKAINMLKKRDADAYTAFCKYVDEVNEKACVVADSHVDKQEAWYNDHKGCYVRGTKVIYIRPKTLDVTQRYEVLRKYSLESKKFWEE